ncbi:MAG: pyridoxal-dependent decarboxylase [Desulfobacteraceae bacterium]
MKNEKQLILEKVFDLVKQQMISNTGNADKPVVRYLSADALKEEIDLSLPDEGVSGDALFKDIETYLQYSVDTGNRQFVNQLYAGPNFPAFVGEIITALTNTSMYTYEVAPVATLIEMALIGKLNQVVGFEHGDGTFLTGGSNANLIAMFTARNKARPEIKTKGASGCARLTAFVSEQSHYSFDTAANLLGIGSDQVCKISTDQNGCMQPDALDAAIQESLRQGATPFFIGATAGTTLLGAYDPIEEIAAVAEKHNVWVHVDGAFGGPVILSRKHRKLLKGLDRVDSFTMDPHKLMNIPLMCSVLLVKEKGRLMHNLTDLDTQYLYHGNDTACYDLGKTSIQCGRRVDALKLWLAWRYFGDKGYAARMDKQMDLAQYAKAKVEESPRLELLAQPQSVAVCFRYRNRNGVEVDDFNLELRERMRKTGKALINYGYWNGNLSLRYVAASPDAEFEDIDTLFEHILDTAKHLEEE